MWLAAARTPPVPPLGCDERTEQGQPGGLAFFGVELAGEDVVAGDGGAEADAVLAGEGDVFGARGVGVVAVHEVEERPGGETGARARGTAHGLVPAHVWDLEAGHVGEPPHASRESPEPHRLGVFLAAREQELHADADAEERPARRERLGDRLAEGAAAAIEPR